MAASSLEIERKYDVDGSAAVPDLSGIGGVQTVRPAKEYLLEATYFDTADLRLRVAGMTLRHRTGGRDAGWHLKLPAGDDREELAVDAPAGAVPEELAALVRARVREQELQPVARLSTRRTVRWLLGPDDVALAEVADDRVTGVALPAGEPLVWREWEAELLDGDRSVLDAVEQCLLAAGAEPSRSGSKLGRVVRRPDVEPAEPRWWEKPAGRGSAGAVLHAHLAEQVAELVARDPQVRRDLPDAVHKMRVATRRLRSALVTFRPLLEAGGLPELRAELRWLAGVLGAPRDAEVMLARLRSLVAAEPEDLVLGKVSERVEAFLTARHSSARDQLLVALDSPRYLHLLDALDALVATPPFRRQARRPGDVALAKLLRRTWNRLETSMAAAQHAPSGPEQDALLHQVRKDAKRARYAAEAVRPVFGRPAKRFAAAVTDLQESLGDFQDGVVTREVLRQLGARGHVAGENAFTFGRLHALEQVRAEQAVARWPKARRAMSRPALRRWFQG